MTTTNTMPKIRILAAAAATLIAGAGALHVGTVAAAPPSQSRPFETLVWMASLSAADGEGAGQAMYTVEQSPVPRWRLTIGVTDTTPGAHLPVILGETMIGMLATNGNGDGTATFHGVGALPGIQDGSTLIVGRLSGQFFSRSCSREFSSDRVILHGPGGDARVVLLAAPGGARPLTRGAS